MKFIITEIHSDIAYYKVIDAKKGVAGEDGVNITLNVKLGNKGIIKRIRNKIDLQIHRDSIIDKEFDCDES